MTLHISVSFEIVHTSVLPTRMRSFVSNHAESLTLVTLALERIADRSKLYRSTTQESKCIDSII